MFRTLNSRDHYLQKELDYRELQPESFPWVTTISFSPYSLPRGLGYFIFAFLMDWNLILRHRYSHRKLGKCHHQHIEIRWKNKKETAG